MRIVHALDSLEAGGAQRVAIGLIDWLCSMGHSVMVIARDGELAASLPSQADLMIATSVADYIVKLRTAVTSFSPDVIHAHQRKEAMLARIATLGVRGPRIVEHAHTRFPKPRHRRLSFRSDAIFAVSEDVSVMLVNEYGVPSEKIVLVENTPAARATTVPTKYSRPDDAHPLRILGIGRLTDQKDPLRFVEVVSKLSESVPVSGVWVGDGPLRAAAERRSLDLGAPVTFAGYQSDVVRYIDDAELLLLTSRWEGLPLVVLEAMARERLVVAPALPALVKLLDKSRGLLFPVDAEPSEVAAILLSSPREIWPTIAAAGRRHVESRQSGEQNNAAILDRYKFLAAR